VSLLEAILLGVVQGLTEFLPISSTAHLTFCGKIFGLIDLEHPEKWTAFIAVLQLGTFFAVAGYFRKNIVTIVQSFFSEFISERRSYQTCSLPAKMGIHIIVGTLPVVVIGLLLKKIIEGGLTKDLWFISGNLMFFALILYVAERNSKRERTIEELRWSDTIAIGCAQVFALFPGASRSGVTISAGLFSGLKREAAAEYSFLLSLPAIFGSGLLEMKEVLYQHKTVSFVPLVAGTVVAGIVGYVSIWFLLRYLKTHSNNIFIGYRLGLGIIILSYLFFSHV